MKILHRHLRGSRFALLSLVVAQGLTLLRSMLIARALGPEQYGIAATFILLQAFLDSTSDTGLNKFVLANAQGHHQRIVATVHYISAWRGVLIAVLLMAVGWPAFVALDVASSPLPFAVLAAASLCIGLTHFDGARQQRASNLLSLSLGNLIAEIVGTAAAALLVLIDQSFIVAIYVILAKSATATLLSFVFARRPYRMAFHRPSAKVIWAYALPLVINGPLLFFAAQAERLAAVFTLPAQQLGVYTAALLLIYTPSQLLLRFLGSVYLPILSREVRDSGAHGRQFGLVTLGCAVAMAVGYAVAGPWLIVLFFGQAYKLDWLTVGIIGLTQSLRFARGWTSGLALAYGHTGQILAANSMRMAVAPLCLAGVWLIGGMLGLAIGALIGETLALIYAVWSSKRAVAQHSATKASRNQFGQLLMPD